MRVHLNEHAAGRYPNLPSVPQAFLDQHALGQCSVCQRFLNLRFQGVCPRCRPAARAAAAAAPPAPPADAGDAAGQPGLPSLRAVFSSRAGTRRHVPKGARALWAQCLVQAVALA
eukprot:3335102-Lingulodinium_polyedra.AAC.1